MLTKSNIGLNNNLNNKLLFCSQLKQTLRNKVAIILKPQKLEFFKGIRFFYIIYYYLYTFCKVASFIGLLSLTTKYLNPSLGLCKSFVKTRYLVTGCRMPLLKNTMRIAVVGNAMTLASVNFRNDGETENFF